jgi:hypothetical protein
VNGGSDPSNNAWTSSAANLVAATDRLTAILSGLALMSATGLVEQTTKQVSNAVAMVDTLTERLARLDAVYHGRQTAITTVVDAAADELRRALAATEQASAALQAGVDVIAAALPPVSVTDEMIGALIGRADLSAPGAP